MKNKISNILANKKEIGTNVEISKDSEIICDYIKIGDGTRILGKTKIECKSCFIGKNNFINCVWIQGSLNAGETKINIGNENLILQNTRLNCNEQIDMGNDVNIGQNVSIWTHSSSMNVLNGYPYVKKPVKIGSHVWITAGTTIMPDIKIGSHIIIGNNSIVNKDIPSGCFAAGSPIKIIKENIFPKKLSIKDKKSIIEDTLKEYRSLLKLKDCNPHIKIIDDLKIYFNYENNETIFDCNEKKITGNENKYSEDFRDFLRYRGIKFFTDKPFKSIKPKWYEKIMKKHK